MDGMLHPVRKAWRVGRIIEVAGLHVDTGDSEDRIGVRDKQEACAAVGRAINTNGKKFI